MWLFVLEIAGTMTNVSKKEHSWLEHSLNTRRNNGMFRNTPFLGRLHFILRTFKASEELKEVILT